MTTTMTVLRNNSVDDTYKNRVIHRTINSTTRRKNPMKKILWEHRGGSENQILGSKLGIRNSEINRTL